MTSGTPKRRFRVRRKRRSAAREVAEQAGGEVVVQFGCCLVEAVTSVAVLGLALVPALLLLH